MKKYIYLFAFVSVSLFLASCEDDSLDPLPTKDIGQFMKLDLQYRQFDANNINNTFIGGTLSNPSNTVVRYELFVRRTNAAGVLTGDYVPLVTINSFPHELRITPAQIATALGLTVNDLQAGDFYRFIAYSYNANGVKAGYTNLARILQISEAVEQGYRFNTELSLLPKPLDQLPVYDNRQI